MALSLAALVLSLIAILDGQKTQRRNEQIQKAQSSLNEQFQKTNEQIQKAQLQPNFLVRELNETKVVNLNGKVQHVDTTVLRVVNEGHGVGCVRVRTVTMVPAIFPALALDDLTDAAHIPAAMLAGKFGITDYYEIENPGNCLSRVTGVLVDIPQAESEWIDVANRNLELLYYLRDLPPPISDADLGLFNSSDAHRVVKQWPKLDPLVRLLPPEGRSLLATYVELSYRDILGTDHASYFKLPGEGLPMDQGLGSQCFKLFDQLTQERERRYSPALGSPQLELLQRMSPDYGPSTGLSCD